MFSFRYHGNYVGPGWSAGRYQPSVAGSTVPAVDEFDETAKQHDAAYARKDNLKDADYKFYKQNIGKGFKRTAAALAVGAQGFFRKPKRSRLGFERPQQSFSQKEKRKMAPLPKTPQKKTRLNPYPSPRYTPVKKGRGYTILKEVSGVKKRLFAAKKKVRAKKTKVSTLRTGRYRKAKTGRTVWDAFSRYGIMIQREYGSTIEGSALARYQSAVVQQATFGCKQILTDVGYGIAKMLAIKCGNYNILSVSAPFMGSNVRGFRIRYFYKVRPNAATATQDFYYGNTSTIATVATDLSNYLNTTHLNVLANFQLISATVFENSVATTPVVEQSQICDVDLRRAKVTMKAKSMLKMQNRTIGSAGSIDAENVDNVPLIGKQYDCPKGNYVVVNDDYISPAIGIESNWSANGGLDGSVFAEPPVLSMVGRAKKSSNVALGPGELKTSEISSTFTLNLNRLFNIIARTDITSNICNLGQSRLFCLEKQLQSLATTDSNAIKVHFETQLDVGVYVLAPRTRTTTSVVTLYPL